MIEELHARLGAQGTYILMVALENKTARRFYDRHGLIEERSIADGNAFYRDSMGVEFAAEAPPVPAIIMRWRGSRGRPR